MVRKDELSNELDENEPPLCYLLVYAKSIGYSPSTEPGSE